MKLYVDMDGVLADFDRHYFNIFGISTSKLTDNVNWKQVNEIPDFFLGIPPMEDMWELWDFVKPYHPTILTGAPQDIQKSPSNKIRWVEKHLGEHVPVITCQSKKKYMYAIPGAILIDDWTKYKHLWEQAGGIWITHTSAKTSIEQLTTLLTC